jgi:hypothetical protein
MVLHLSLKVHSHLFDKHVSAFGGTQTDVRYYPEAVQPCFYSVTPFSQVSVLILSQHLQLSIPRQMSDKEY